MKWISGRLEGTAFDAIRSTIDSAPDYYAGELEVLRAKLDKTMNILATVVNSLPEAQQKQIVETECYSWTEVKE